jgi:hypothetical protein
VLQAILIPAYVWRKEFRSRAEAMIRSAAAAVAIAGIGEAVFLKTAASFGGFRSYWDSNRLQADYVLTVLLFAGLAGGTALGTLRWHVLQRQRRVQAIARVSDSRWNNYLRSAVLWIASDRFRLANRMAPVSRIFLAGQLPCLGGFIRACS